MRNKLLLLFVFVFFLTFTSRASHVVGGSLTYEQLSGTTYRITLKLYRDCRTTGPPPIPVAFNSTITVNIRRADGSNPTITSVDLPKGPSAFVPPNIDTCAAKSTICLEEAIYTKIISLPPVSGGYHLWAPYCCRNAMVPNIIDPSGQGNVYYTRIPDNGIIISNSSPKWVSPPPVFVCVGTNMSVDHSATDADGDSLVYSLYTPYTTPSSGFPKYTGGIFTTDTVVWDTSGYGKNNPLDPTTPNSLTISSTGVLHGVPPTIGGYYVAGVQCEEWRNGVKIGEILRDFQFNVISCPPLAESKFLISNDGCFGKTIKFTFDASFNQTPYTYLWDFGDGTPTSNLKNPTHTYASLGGYNVRLIVNPGTACADTSFQPVYISYIISDFKSNAPQCKGLPVNFNDSVTVDPLRTISSWDWNFGDGFTSTSANPTHTFTSGGTYAVKLVSTSSAGCKDTMTHTVTIQGYPIANAGNDTASCYNKPTLTLGGTVVNAGGGLWNGSGIFNPSAGTLNPTYTPSAAAIATGYEILSLYSTANGFCPADTDQVLISYYPGPTADIGADIFVCKDTSYVPVCVTLNRSTGGTWGTKGTGTFVSLNSVCARYTPSTADTAAGSVILFVETTGNGMCSPSWDSVLVTFTGTPVAVITSGDTACGGKPFAISGTSTTGSGIWSSMGTGGTFSPDDELLNSSYQPSKSDDSAGKVTLIFSSTNNGGCKSQSDSMDVVLLGPPYTAFTSISNCPNDTLSFFDKTTAIGNIVSWDWNFGDTTTSNVQNPTHVFSTAGLHTVSLIVVTNSGCEDTLSQLVKVYDKPVANIGVSRFCFKDGTVFTDLSTVGGGAFISAWSWDYADSTVVDTIQNTVHFFADTGTYNTSLIVHSSEGCIDTVSQSVTVLPSPTVDFTSNDYLGIVDQTISFSNKSSSDVVDWLWNFGDSSADSAATVENPTHIYEKTGFFDVCLVVMAINDCADTICKTEIISMPPQVPSGFSPNGDGENDILYVYGGPFKKVNFKIYNNWGQLIFESNDQKTGWDGTFSGIIQPIGVYVFTVTGTSQEDSDYSFSGDVTLLR